MDLKTIKKLSLQKVNEFSNNGNLISESNNKDYALRMNGFINEAQFEIAQIRKLQKTYTLPATPDAATTGYKQYLMPADFMEPFVFLVDDEENHDYKWIGKILMISKDAAGEGVLHYYKYPTVITDETADTTELEVDIDAQLLIPFYVGGFVVLDENPQIGQKLLAQYGAGMARLRSNRGVEPLTMRVE